MSRAGYRLMQEKDYSNPLEWEERLFFSAMKNQDLAWMTKGEFRDDKKPYGTHPVFILRRIERDTFKFCPCSSQSYNRGKASYIRENARTAPNNLRVDRNSYILHFIVFNLTADSPLIDRMPLLGRVAEDDIEGYFYRNEVGK